MAYFSLTRVRLEKILWTIMFTIIAGSEFMIAVIVVKSESSKTLVTLSLSRRKQQHVPGIARPCGPQVLSDNNKINHTALCRLPLARHKDNQEAVMQMCKRCCHSKENKFLCFWVNQTLLGMTNHKSISSSAS